MPNIGVPELIIILIILLLIVGAKKLPELARSLGSSAKEFRNAASGESEKTDKPKPKK